MEGKPQALAAAAWRVRPQLWPALAHTLAALVSRAALLPADLCECNPEHCAYTLDGGQASGAGAGGGVARAAAAVAGADAHTGRAGAARCPAARGPL
ncbi:unnamed protein product [Parnassius apollo]|uniref:(apollo) hypothetical protein n=1 Tax=Parnassius apollo TaxID=110799 RepID=A0A8S3XN97_PARAO|nr:unnamed protein product [Parnassius apollo]